MNRRNLCLTGLAALSAPSLIYGQIKTKKTTHFSIKTRCGYSQKNGPFIEDLELLDDEQSQHEVFLKQAIVLSESAMNHCNHPFGALLVYRGDVILKAENRVFTDGDATQHGEFRLVTEANKSQNISQKTLSRSTLYTSAEPCAMCCGAIFWSGIRKVVYSAPHDSFGSGRFPVPSREIFKYARRSDTPGRDHSLIVIGPLLQNLSVPIVKKYFDEQVGQEAAKCKISLKTEMAL